MAFADVWTNTRPVTERIRMGVALSELGRSRRRQGRADGPTRANLDAFCKALTDASGLKIVAYAAPRYDRLVHRLRLTEVELAWLPPIVALSAARTKAIPLALPLRGQTPWFWSALYTSETSKIRGLSDLTSAHAIWVDSESASGYLVIRAALRAEGVDVDQAFARESFAGSHDEVLRQVLAADSAVGATYLHLDEDGQIERAGWGARRVRVLKRAGPIPADALTAASSLSREVQQKLSFLLVDKPSEALTNAARELFGADAFTRAEPAHMAHLEALSRYLLRARAR